MAKENETKRLTKRDGNKVWFAKGRPKGFLCPDNFCFNSITCDKVKDRTCPYLQLLDKLAAYEDAEEQGLLLRLPCKVGDTVYWCPDLNDRTWILSAEVTDIFVWHGGQIRLSLPDLNIEPIVPNAHLFFTREEAKAALKGEREDV